MAKAFIDGKSFEYKEGESVLSFVRRNQGRDSIPTLCDAPNLEGFGSCRVCSVDVKNEAGTCRTVASCHTPVVEGMQVLPNSDRVKRLRKNIVELVLTDHPLDCLTCQANGDCELQDVAASVGIREVRYPEGKNHLHYEKDLSHPYMRSDLSKCINCFRCVRACDEVQGQFVLDMQGRGFDSKIIKSFDESFDESDCVSCGACSQACPTSAIFDVFQEQKYKAKKTVRTVCTYCGVGCNLDVSINEKEIVSIEAPYDAEVNQGHTCLKGRYAFKFYNHRDRLRTPLIRKGGELVEATWDEAYDFIAAKLKAIVRDGGPDAVAGISSARCTNEENYLMQKMLRAVIGTNNIDCCARVCHSPTAIGMQRTFGTGAATNSIEDLKFTEAMLVVGANPTISHPVTGAKIKQQAISGKTLIVIDPQETEMARYADFHLQLRPGTNVAVLNMMIHYIIKEDLVDESFVSTRCEGYEDFKDHALSLDIAALEEVSGVDRNLAREAAVAYAKANGAMSFHGLGVTEHSQGTFTVMLIANLAMLTGNIGIPGAGVNPLRGQNNVQGAADMGAQPYQGAGYLDITDAKAQKLYEAHYGRPVPTQSGYKISEMFRAAGRGDLKALWLMGEDVVQTDPNTDLVISDLENLELLVVQELFMTESAKLATVVLPASSFFEKNGTFTNGERRVQRVNRVVPPLPGTKPDGEIMVDIMNRLGYPQPEYSAEAMVEEISGIVPFFKEIDWEDLGENGRQWPVLEKGVDTKILHTESFKRGKGKFYSFDFIESEELKVNASEYPFILTTVRDLEHYNCGSMTRRTDNVKILSEDVLLMNPEDAKEKGISDCDKVKVFSPRGEIKISVRTSDIVKPGVVSTTFHFPEIMINRVTSDIYDSEAMCPEYKVVAVGVERAPS